MKVENVSMQQSNSCYCPSSPEYSFRDQNQQDSEGLGYIRKAWMTLRKPILYKQRATKMLNCKVYTTTGQWKHNKVTHSSLLTDMHLSSISNTLDVLSF